MNAREMFEALGYEEQFKNSDIYRNKKDGSRIGVDVMNAREMFEEQRYKRNEENDEITYFQRFGSGYFRIKFDLSKEEIAIDTNMENVIESDLLQAIIQQVKELHWLYEKIEIKKARNPEVTNLEYYKDEIIEDFWASLAVVKGRPKLCYKTSCNNCDFKLFQKGCHNKVKEWLKQPHKKPTYKLTKFEKELLECYSDVYSFKVFNSLNGMKEKGYFKCIDDNELIGDILAKCEVVG